MNKQPAKLHHAYAIVGDRTRGRAHVEALITDELGMTLAANPDIHFFETDTYAIDDARLLKADHYVKSLGARSIFVASFASITSEAQQSLLKVTEDPVPNVHFFFLMPSLQGILPTLRSRFLIVHVDADESAGGKTAGAAGASRAKKFLASTPPKRLEMVAKLIEDKDKSAVLDFLNELESLAPALVKEGKFAEAKALGETIKLRGFLQSRAASLKMILEHISVTLPRLNFYSDYSSLRL